MKTLKNRVNNFLLSGFEFSSREELLKLRFKLFNAILGSIIFISLCIAVGSYFKLFPQMDELFTLFVLLYPLLMSLILIYLRRSKRYFRSALIALLLVSLVISVLILYYNTMDKIRILWFIPLVMSMFVLGGKKFGFFALVSSVIIILSMHFIPERENFTHIEVAEFIFLLTFISFIFSLIIDLFIHETETLVQRVQKEVTNNRLKDEELLRSSKLAQMGELLSIISHQWKQPLSTISMYTADSMIGLELGDKLTHQEQKDIYTNIDKQVRFLSKTMDDFRHFYNPNKSLKIMHMPHVIDQAVEILSPKLLKSNITVHKVFQFNLPLHSYPNEITQAMLILLKNAIDAHNDHKLNHHKRIHISGFEEQNLWIVEVRDNAGGINKEDLPHIFTQFFTTKSSKEGTGLGLYLCKTIIEDSCRGSIEVFPIDNGTLFRFSIPNQK